MLLTRFAVLLLYRLFVMQQPIVGVLKEPSHRPSGDGKTWVPRILGRTIDVENSQYAAEVRAKSSFKVHVVIEKF